MSARRPVALITGASSGIGAALARIFAAHRHDLALVALPGPELVPLAREIAATGSSLALTLELDLTEPDATARIDALMAAHRVEPAFIVNCAGFGLLGPAAELALEDQLAMIDLNVRVLADLSLRHVDSLARHRGGILNVASLSAFCPAPEMAVYNASKAFVLSLGEALHCELKERGVRVTTLCSGPVPTQFQRRAGIRADLPRLLACSPTRVARAAYAGLMAGKRIVIPGLSNNLLTLFLRFGPKRVLLPGNRVAMRYSSRPSAKRSFPLFRRSRDGELVQ